MALTQPKESTCIRKVIKILHLPALSFCSLLVKRILPIWVDSKSTLTAFATDRENTMLSKSLFFGKKLLLCPDPLCLQHINL